MVSALVNAAQQLAIEDDPGLRSAKLPMAEVEATLTAALAEPDIAEQVRSGRLVKAVTYAGFGEVPRPRLRLVTADESDEDEAEDEDEAADEAPPNPFAVVPESERTARPAVLEERKRRAAEKARQERAERRRELKRRLTTARAAEARTRTRLEHAEAAERDAAHAVDEIEEQLAELERQRIVAQAEVSRRKLARRSAERDASAARREVGDVEAALEDLDADEPDQTAHFPEPVRGSRIGQVTPEQAAANAKPGLANLVGAFAESPQTLRRARLHGVVRVGVPRVGPGRRAR